MKQPEFEKLYLEQGAMPVGNTSEEFAKFIAGEMVKWRTVVNDTGVKLN